MVVPTLATPGTGAVLLSGLLEGIGIPWPGAVVLAAAGANAQSGVIALLAGTWFALMYLGGSLIQYLIGRYCRSVLGVFLSQPQQVRLDRLVHRYGQVAVLWTRPLAVGNYVSIPAGLMKMDPLKFLFFTLMGIWPWAFAMAFAGSYLGSEIALVDKLLPYLAGVLAVVGLWPVFVRLRSRESRRKRRSLQRLPHADEPAIGA